MREDYLWDRTGTPDPEIERLERVLAPLRYRHQPIRRESRRVWAAAAAAVVIAGIALSLVTAPGARTTAWEVSSLQGSAQMGRRNAAISMALGSGQLLRTGGDSAVTLQSDDVGRIDIGADSELRAASSRKVVLQRGTLHAFIWAPPREFVVDTPSSRAVDLGCEYTLQVDPSGSGVLRVEMGWVAFQFDGRESFIPAGAQCATHKSTGPGVPFYRDAPAPLQQAIATFDRGDTGVLPAILENARPQDGLTLWHLLARVEESRRGEVFDRFASLVGVPAGVTRDAVLRRDPAAMDLCWNALNLENTGWWRGWERPWR